MQFSIDIETFKLLFIHLVPRAVPLINLWEGGGDGNFFLAVPPSGFMPVAAGPPPGTVTLTNPHPPETL